MKQWQLQVAKAKFSELVRDASTRGPQEITLHGEPVVVILSKSLYDNLKANKPSFSEFIRNSPLAGLNIDFERNPSKNRDIDL